MEKREGRRLSELAPGESAVVAELHCGGYLGNRLMAMALIPGTDVRVLGVAPLGDPIMVKAGSYSLSLRKKEAFQIEVR